jgi:hypothetical protein
MESRVTSSVTSRLTCITAALDRCATYRKPPRTAIRLSTATEDEGVWCLRGLAACRFLLVNEFSLTWRIGASRRALVVPTPPTCSRFDTAPRPDPTST